jgi:hypothetical protein
MVIGSSTTLAILHFAAATAEGAPRNVAQTISTALSRINGMDVSATVNLEDRSRDPARTFPVCQRTRASLHLNCVGGQGIDLMAFKSMADTHPWQELDSS